MTARPLHRVAYYYDTGYSPEEAATRLGIPADQVEAAFFALDDNRQRAHRAALARAHARFAAAIGARRYDERG